MSLLERYLEELEQAILSDDLDKVNKINKKILRLIETGQDNYNSIEFIEKIKGKSVFKNLIRVMRGERLDLLSFVKLIASLVTHLVIECEQKNLDIKDFKIEEYFDIALSLIYKQDYDSAEKFLKDKYKDCFYDLD